MKKTGFTLTEVLITLGVIGVIAAITIPNLVKTYQKHVTVNRLKHTYSILSEAIKRSEVDNGPLETWDIPTGIWENDNQYKLGKPFAEKYLLPYVKTSIKDCGLRPNKCMAEKYYSLGKKEYYRGALVNHYYSFMLENGVFVGIDLNGDRFYLMIDINGKSKPNVIGKDYFTMVVAASGVNNVDIITNKPGFYMVGYGYDKNVILNDNVRGCKKSTTSYNTYCGTLIMLDGWEIKNDYPW